MPNYFYKQKFANPRHQPICCNKDMNRQLLSAGMVTLIAYFSSLQINSLHHSLTY